MQFTLVDDAPPALLIVLLALWGPLLIPVGLPLLLWLRRSPRQTRDVLLAVVRTPAGLVRRSLDFLGWLFAAASLVGGQLLVMALMFSTLRFFLESDSPRGEGTGWIVMPTLAGGLALVLWMVLERGPRAAHDVLHVRAGQR
jgi:hypothetical protein